MDESNKMLHLKGLVSKANGEAEGRLMASVATSEVIDRMGEVVSVDGMDLRNFKKNPVLLWAHNATMTEGRPPIGKVVKTWIDGIKKKKLLFSVQFDMNDEFARMIYDKYKNGFLNAFSIGFQALEKDGDTFTKSELLEISAVPVPANPEALTILREAKIEAVDWKKFFEEKGLTSQNIMKEDEEEDKKEEKTEDEEVKPEDQDKKTIAEMQTKINDLEKQIKDLKEDKKNLKALRDSMKILVTVSNLALNRINEQSRGGE